MKVVYGSGCTFVVAMVSVACCAEFDGALEKVKLSEVYPLVVAVTGAASKPPSRAKLIKEMGTQLVTVVLAPA